MLHAMPATKAPSPADEFAAYCCELLGSVGPCNAKRMFGGHGISTSGITIAIIAWDTLFLKTNTDTEAQWAAAGCKPFMYEAKGKTMKLNYYSAPPEALESRELMRPWAQLALQAGVAARAKSSKSKLPLAGKKTARAATKRVATAPKPLAPKARSK
jgi:DNA transformation protein and related proteins